MKGKQQANIEIDTQKHEKGSLELIPQKQKALWLDFDRNPQSNYSQPNKID